MNVTTILKVSLAILALAHPASSGQMVITLQEGLQMAFDRNEILRVARGTSTVRTRS